MLNFDRTTNNNGGVAVRHLWIISAALAILSLMRLIGAFSADTQPEQNISIHHAQGPWPEQSQEQQRKQNTNTNTNSTSVDATQWDPSRPNASNLDPYQEKTPAPAQILAQGINLNYSKIESILGPFRILTPRSNDVQCSLRLITILQPCLINENLQRGAEQFPPQPEMMKIDSYFRLSNLPNRIRSSFSLACCDLSRAIECFHRQIEQEPACRSESKRDLFAAFETQINQWRQAGCDTNQIQRNCPEHLSTFNSSPSSTSTPSISTSTPPNLWQKDSFDRNTSNTSWQLSANRSKQTFANNLVFASSSSSASWSSLLFSARTFRNWSNAMLLFPLLLLFMYR